MRALFACALLAAAPGFAQTPVALYRSYAGNIQFTGTAGTFRTAPNSGPGANPCAVGANATATLSGIPAGATVVAAHLYWAGSGATTDANVTFAGPFGTTGGVTADRTFTETYTTGGNTFRFFSGYEDVGALVTGNGNYTLSNLTVTNTNVAGASYCTSQAVVAGWNLVVVYSRASEPLRVVNVSDGFQAFRGAQLAIIDTNFQAPASGTIDSFVSHVTWEGDTENSSAFNGQTENLRFQGTALTDALNPLNNQFNSASNIIGSATTWGVDFDRYNVSSLVAPGQTSATTTYSSGGDLVLLTAEIFSVTNVPNADLALAKSHAGNFTTGQNGTYTLTVSNAGPSTATGPTTVTDTLPAGLTYVSAIGTGWTCNAVAQVVTCTHASAIANGGALPAIALTVSVAANAPASLTNTAAVSNPTFDNVAPNNTASDPTTIVQLPDVLVIKSAVVLNDPVNAPGIRRRFPARTCGTRSV
jgi:MSHA biogenesis protein MshQ